MKRHGYLCVLVCLCILFTGNADLCFSYMYRSIWDLQERDTRLENMFINGIVKQFARESLIAILS